MINSLRFRGTANNDLARNVDFFINVYEKFANNRNYESGRIKCTYRRRKYQCFDCNNNNC